jgi:hypothetical protein
VIGANGSDGYWTALVDSVAEETYLQAVTNDAAVVVDGDIIRYEVALDPYSKYQSPFMLNYSFEAPAVDTFEYGIDVWNDSGSFTVNAQNAANNGSINDASQIDGDQFAQIPGHGWIYQLTGHNIEVGDVIDANSLVGRFTDGVGVGYAGYKLQLVTSPGLESETILAQDDNGQNPTAGNFVFASLSYTVQTTDPIGEELAVRIIPESASTNWVLIDNVGLTINGQSLTNQVVDLADYHLMGLDVVFHSAYGYMLAYDSTPDKSSDFSNILDMRLTGETECGEWGYPIADINTDCIVNLVDFAELAQEWLIQ